MVFTLGVNAQVRKTDTLTKSKKAQRINQKIIKPNLIKKEKKEESQTLKPTLTLSPKVSEVSFLKEFKTEGEFTDNSNTYGKRVLKVVAEGNDYKDKFEVNVEDVKSTKTESEEDGVTLVCMDQTITVDSNTASFEEFIGKGVSPWLQPGMVMHVDDYFNFNRSPLVARRNPITIYTEMNRNGGSIKKVVENPHSPSNIQSALTTLSEDGNVGSNFEFDYTEIVNIDQFSFDLYGEYRNNMVNFGVSAGHSKEERKESYYYKIELFQNMFSVAVDPLVAENVFVEEQPNLDEFLYVSRVNYGRRVIIVVESDLKLSSKENDLRVELNSLVHSAVMDYSYQRSKLSNQLRIKAFFYGGESTNDFALVGDLIRNGTIGVRESLADYFEGLASRSEFAKPISYEIRNLNNQRMAMESVFTQTIQTCIPEITENIKLKVTLESLQNVNTRSSRTTHDTYGLQQYIDLKIAHNITEHTNVKRHNGEAEYRKFENRIGEPNAEGKPAQVNQIINGDGNHQISERVNRSTNFNANINNSLTFVIPPRIFAEGELKAEYQFRIYTWLKEYTRTKNVIGDNTEPKVLINWEYIDVDIKQVIHYLINPSSLIFDSKLYTDFYPEGEVFTETGASKINMPFKKGEDNTLMGAIVLNISGTNATAIAWYRFELVED